MTPKTAVRAVVEAVPGALFVSSLGTATSALQAVTDEGPHLYMGGAMGCALATAIGVAEARPERAVVAIVGDGETLMGATALWALAGIRPSNLLVAVLVDGRYAITGGQPLGSPGAFAEVAGALGLGSAVARDDAGIHEGIARLPRPAVLEIRYEEAEWPGPSAFVDPPIVRWRFEAAATAGLEDGAR